MQSVEHVQPIGRKDVPASVAVWGTRGLAFRLLLLFLFVLLGFVFAWF